MHDNALLLFMELRKRSSVRWWTSGYRRATSAPSHSHCFWTAMRASERPGAIAAARACRPDIRQFCGSVAPGKGRIKACIKAQMAELSDAAAGSVAAVTTRCSGRSFEGGGAWRRPEHRCNAGSAGAGSWPPKRAVCRRIAQNRSVVRLLIRPPILGRDQ
jgi:hypothetical protein